MPVPTAYIATSAPAVVEISTPIAGPAMKDNSVVIESRANAGSRCDSGASAAMDCRATANAGSDRNPPNSAATSSAQYGMWGEENQNSTSATVVSTSTGRRPRRSVIRPITGAPSEPPTVNAAPTMPAAK